MILNLCLLRSNPKVKVCGSVLGRRLMDTSVGLEFLGVRRKEETQMFLALKKTTGLT